jgi:hypothetical protein
MKNITFVAVAVAAALSPVVLAETSIDILGVYTTETANKMDHTAAIQHRFNVGNQILKRSQVDVKINLIGLKEYNYDSKPGRKKSQDQAIDAITPSKKQSPIFADIERVREEKGADMVALFRYLDTNNSPDYDRGSISCGIAWIIPALNWQSRWHAGAAKSGMYSHSYINECGDNTFIHELGHNFGLNHAREQYKHLPKLPHEKGRTDKDAYGYGVQGKFATTMAYGYEFGVWGSSYTFSNPDTQCGGQACGVRGEANASRVIRVSAPHIANIYPSKSDPVIPTDTETPNNPATPTQPETPSQPETPNDPKESGKTFSFGKNIKIPDEAELELPVSVSHDKQFKQAVVKINIDHGHVGDLSIKLIDPDGNNFTIKKTNRHDRKKYYIMTYTLKFARPINVDGQWKLAINDRYTEDEGVLNSATVTFE